MNLETIEHITTASLCQFWETVNQWYELPQTINRRICFAEKLIFCRLTVPEDIESITLLSVIEKILLDTETVNVCAKWLLYKFDKAGIGVLQMEETKFMEPGRYICIKKLVPKVSKFYKPSLEIVIKDTVINSITFLGLVETERKQYLLSNVPYHIQYLQTKDYPRIWLVIESSGNTRLNKWLKENMFDKIIKLAETADGSNSKNLNNLVDIMFFNIYYQKLKNKYASEIQKIWPKVINVQTFMCEDIAVAAYLILLWRSHYLKYGIKDKMTFVDLKCGNGLLVHILNSEGYLGIGFDDDRRDIWGIYPETTKLEERALPLSDDVLYPEADWLIGNRSKELTPWIPIIAAKSSYNCQFVIRLCCPCEPNGQKCQWIGSTQSQSEDYMHFLENLCKVCGFVGTIDQLNTPSAKRTFLIGRERIYPEEDQKKIDKTIKEYIQTRMKEDKSKIKGDSSESYRPQLDQVLVGSVLACITQKILAKKRLVTMTNSRGQEKAWNAGGICTMTELAQDISKAQLIRLRELFGGLSMLLKKHCHIFHVNDQKVSLKIPKPSFTKCELKKEKPCWFHWHHPQGCPLAHEECIFKH